MTPIDFLEDQLELRPERTERADGAVQWLWPLDTGKLEVLFHPDTKKYDLRLDSSKGYLKGSLEEGARDYTLLDYAVAQIESESYY